MRRRNITLGEDFQESNATSLRKDYSVKISKSPLGLSLTVPKDAVAVLLLYSCYLQPESTVKNLKMER